MSQTPTYDKGATGPDDRVGIFPGRPRSIEEVHKLRGDRDVHECRFLVADPRNACRYREAKCALEQIALSVLET